MRRRAEEVAGVGGLGDHPRLGPGDLVVGDTLGEQPRHLGLDRRLDAGEIGRRARAGVKAELGRAAAGRVIVGAGADGEPVLTDQLTV